jgi:hypothetical protein
MSCDCFAVRSAQTVTQFGCYDQLKTETDAHKTSRRPAHAGQGHLPIGLFHQR